MPLTFGRVSAIGGVLCLGLTAVWLFFPQYLLLLWSVESTSGSLLFARRGAALFLALAVLLLQARGLRNAEARRAIATSLTVGCAALASLGLYEFFAGHAGMGIFSAVIVELLLAAAFFAVRNQREIG